MSGRSIEQHERHGQEEEQGNESREQLIQEPPLPVAAQASRRRRPALLVIAASATLERLPERDGDCDRAVAFLPVERHAEVDADRPEARIIARPRCPAAKRHLRKSGRARSLSDPPSKKGTTPKLPPNCFRRMRASSRIRQAPDRRWDLRPCPWDRAADSRSRAPNRRRPNRSAAMEQDRNCSRRRSSRTGPGPAATTRSETDGRRSRRSGCAHK